jgi:hypothetical protein
MISPSPPGFHLAGLNAVNRGTFGPVRLPINYRGSLTPAIRVFLISFFGIPYFPKKKGSRMAPREDRALPRRRPGART